MPDMKLTRRAAFILPLLLAACAATPPKVFEPLDYSYLTKLKLDVGNIEIDDSWVPRGGGRHVEYLAPTRPIVALRRMAEQRLVPGGTAGRAVFTIDDASIFQGPSRYEGSLAVHLEVFDAQGNSKGSIYARVRATRSITDEGDPEAVREDLYVLTRKMMDDMNVEFEYQLRKGLNSVLQTTDTTAPPPPPVQQQDLSAPGATQAAPAAAPAPATTAAPAASPAAPIQFSPPPGPLKLPAKP
jgi:hypothetical protein